MGGLACAVRLAASGHDITVIEKESHVGGKARRVAVDGTPIDAGPTVFTLRDVFDEVFELAGRSLDDCVSVRPAHVLARHAWDATGHLDLYADPARSEDAIGDFAGADAARGYRSFRTEAARIYGILEHSMLRADKVSWPLPLMRRIGLARIGDLLAIRPCESLWKVLGEHFADPRLRQLFGRYSTYCGSSPFDTPATLMLIAHVEAQGVWLIDGGMSALAEALRGVAEEHGARFRTGTAVEGVEFHNGRACGVSVESGEFIAADAVVVNADPSALASGALGRNAARAVAPIKPGKRSLSAMVWLAHARSDGFPLSRHNVFFSPDYVREFADISRGAVPGDPSVYVCALDRGAGSGAALTGRERFQIIVNAPANGDTFDFTAQEEERCTRAMRRTLERCSLQLEDPLPHRLLTPNDFERFSPSTGGAIYGRASHGWAASFLRQGARTRIPGLYCAGGSTHPGAGVPMAALSGRLAAQQVAQDLASMRRFHLVATPGGMSMRSAKTGGTV
ncbi:CrtD protein [Erythrobacter sp. QSSC1-22B]|nr:CrtD protein [Erythrobacter sp. QSSC1-22B]